MRPPRLFAAMLAVAASAPLLAAAQKPGSTDLPVTSLIGDYDSGVASSLQIQSDQGGAYRDSAAVRSVIDSRGTWAVDSYYVKGATRTIYLDFSDPIAGTGPGGGAPAAPPSGYYRARIGTECYRYGNSLLTLSAGGTMACPMNVHFDYGGQTYDLHMSDQNTNFPETNHVTVTCLYPASGSGPCSQWRITPSASEVAADGSVRWRNVANLSREKTVKGQLTYVQQGDFYVSFSIIVTNP